MDASIKPVVWLGDSLHALWTFPPAVQDEIGYALFLARRGDKHVSAKPLKGLGAGVLEVVADHRGGTFRAMYTVRLADRVPPRQPTIRKPAVAKWLSNAKATRIRR